MSWTFEKETKITEHISIQSILKNFMKFGVFKKIRTRTGLKVQKNCKICDEDFDENHMVHLAINHGKSGNFLLCSNCLDEANNHPIPIHEHEKV